MPGKKTMKQAKKLGIKGTGYRAGKKIPKKKNREETLQKYYSGLMDVAKQKAEAKKNNKKIVKKQVGGLASLVRNPKKLGIRGQGFPFKSGQAVDPRLPRGKVGKGPLEPSESIARVFKVPKRGGLARGPGIKAGGKVPSYNELVTAKLMKKGGKIK